MQRAGTPLPGSDGVWRRMVLVALLIMVVPELRADDRPDLARPTGAGSDFSLDASVIAAGGGLSSGGDYVVQGTIGQPEADAQHPATGGPFVLIAGFWGAVRPPGFPTLDLVFRDRFDDEA
ncbi:MAG: hypothetical protein EA419_06565 [Wenzhouxiangella sp.]|nr:MAG: hypothetical protein EA419_06565 [Wenzhouxiangella sp.]